MIYKKTRAERLPSPTPGFGLSALITETQLAEWLGCSRKQTYRWRKNGEGPRYYRGLHYRQGRSTIFYRALDVAYWFESNIVHLSDEWWFAFCEHSRNIEYKNPPKKRVFQMVEGCKQRRKKPWMGRSNVSRKNTVCIELEDGSIELHFSGEKTVNKTVGAYLRSMRELYETIPE